MIKRATIVLLSERFLEFVNKVMSGKLQKEQEVSQVFKKLTKKEVKPVKKGMKVKKTVVVKGKSKKK